VKCHSAKRLAYRAQNPERDRQAVRRWAARHPETANANAKRRYEQNRERRIEQAREWNRRNKAKRSVIMAFQNAKRRSRKQANGGRGFTKAHWRELVSRSGGLCAFCRESPASSIDHFVPLSRGGADDFANIVPACRLCNSKKRHNEPTAWVLTTHGAERLAFVRSVMLS
jgi:5-methylcytosine-specific restriction endonuclease McrA